MNKISKENKTSRHMYCTTKHNSNNIGQLGKPKTISYHQQISINTKNGGSLSKKDRNSGKNFSHVTREVEPQNLSTRSKRKLQQIQCRCKAPFVSSINGISVKKIGNSDYCRECNQTSKLMNTVSKNIKK